MTRSSSRRIALVAVLHAVACRGDSAGVEPDPAAGDSGSTGSSTTGGDVEPPPGDPTIYPEPIPELVPEWFFDACTGANKGPLGFCYGEGLELPAGFPRSTAFPAHVNGDEVRDFVSGTSRLWMVEFEEDGRVPFEREKTGISDVNFVRLLRLSEDKFGIVGLADDFVVVAVRDSQRGYAEPETYPLEGRLIPGQIVDLDLDGSQELLIADADGDRIGILGFDQAGVVIREDWLPVGSNPLDVRAGDVDGDGDLDLAAAVANDDAIAILRADEDGSFASPDLVATGQSPRSVALADLDDDGRADIVTANYLSGDLTVALAQEDGTWSDARKPVKYLLPRQVVAANFDGDRRVDVVVASAGFAALEVMWGDGTGDFEGEQVLELDHVPTLSRQDLDSDGREEIVLGDDNQTIVIGSEGDRELAEMFRFGTAGGHAALADLDADGTEDLVDVYLGWLYHLRDVDSRRGPISYAARHQISELLAVEDLDGDGSDDVLALNLDEDRLLLYRGPVRANAAAPELLAHSLHPGIILADLDNDGRHDVLTHGGGCKVLLAGEAGRYSSALEVDVECLDPAVADFDGDGALDLAAFRGGRIAVARGDGSGRFSPWYDDEIVPGHAVVADYDRDGLPDIGVRLGCCRLFVYHSQPAGGLSGPLRILLPEQFASGLSSGDLDGDGILELWTVFNGTWLLVPDAAGGVSGHRLTEEDCGRMAVDLNADGVIDLRPDKDSGPFCESRF